MFLSDRRSALVAGIVFAISGCARAASGSGGGVLPESYSVEQSLSMMPATRQKIYVTNLGPQETGPFTVTVYATGSKGNVSPIDILAGNHTDLRAPDGVAVGATGKLYVANIGPLDSGPYTLTVYAPGAHGNAAPAAKIEGTHTDLNTPSLIALGKTGKIYVPNFDGNSVTVYVPAANGNATPVAKIEGSDTGLNDPSGISIGSTGKIYVTSQGNNSVRVYAPAANGNVSPITVIKGSHTGFNNPSGIALDGTGKIYVSNFNSSSITVFAAAATGNATPVATIEGAGTGLSSPSSLALDAAGRIYVTNLGVGDFGPYTLTVYAATANGNVPPIATIAGPDTDLVFPVSLTVH